MLLEHVLAWLYVPASRPELIPKAALAAPGIVVDLEDAVHPQERAQARAGLAEALSTSQAVPTIVRVNPVGSSDFAADIEALTGLATAGRIQGIRLAKVDTPEQVAVARAATADWPLARPLICQLETAAAVEAAHSIATQDGVHSLMLGEGDLRADLRLPKGRLGDPGLLLSRMRVVLASRSAGLPSPVGSAFTNVSDLVGLTETSMELRSLGFLGRSCLHPRQVDAVIKAFTPTYEELEWARSIVESAIEMDELGNAAKALGDGSFIDPAIVKHANSILIAGNLQ